MVTHFEATLTLLGIVIGMLSTLITVIWKAKGWVDRLNTTDSDLAKAITNLAATMQQLHAENQRRFEGIEQRLNATGSRGSARSR